MTKSACAIPAEFDICLSNICNMSCRYCYWADEAKIKPAKLSFEQISRGLKLYLKNRIGGIEKIALGGGEPLLDFPLLAKVVKHIRREAGAKTEIELFTNGTLINKNNADFLLSHDIKIIISIDGTKKTTDLNRRFKKTPSKSVFDIVTGNLGKLNPEMLGQMCAGATFNSKTVRHMAANMEFLSDLGFREVLVDMDILEIWKPSGLKLLEKILPEVKRLCVKMAHKSLLNYGRSPIGLDFIFSEEEKKAILNLSSFRELSLGPDGCFYPSGLVSAQGPARSLYKLGDLKSGIDFKKIKTALKEVKDYFSTARFKGYAACPVNLYFYNRIAGNNPAKLFTGMEKVYFSSLNIHQLVESDRIAALLETDRDFGDFSHKPKYKCRANISHMRVKMSARGKLLELKQARQAVDYMLYSPGDKKELVLSGCFNPAVSDHIKCVCVYALLKANHLNKKIRIVMEAEKNEWPNSQETDFMAEHGIFFRLRRDLPTNGNLAELSRKLRPDKIQMEILTNETTWPAQIDKTAKVGIFNFLITAKKPARGPVWTKFEKKFLSRPANGQNIFFMNFFHLLRNPDNSKTAGECRASQKLEMDIDGSLKFAQGKSTVADTKRDFGGKRKIHGDKENFAKSIDYLSKNAFKNPNQADLDKKFGELLGKLIVSKTGRDYIKQCCGEMNRHSFFHYPASGEN